MPVLRLLCRRHQTPDTADTNVTDRRKLEMDGGGQVTGVGGELFAVTTGHKQVHNK